MSKAPKDWLASKSTINLIKGFLSRSVLSLPDVLKNALEFANHEGYKGIEETIGMLSTLSALIYDPEVGQAYAVNVGDSRIYGLTGNEWRQLSKDDVSIEPVLKNGKMLLQNGSPIMKSALTKAIGAPRLEEIGVEILDVNNFDALALTSDGIHGLAAFKRILSEVYNSPDMNQAIVNRKESMISKLDDDASMALLRFHSPGQIELKSILDGESQDLPVFAVMHTIEMNLERSISEGNDDLTGQLLEFADANQLAFNRDRMIAFLEGMIKYRSKNIDVMTRIIRRL